MRFGLRFDFRNPASAGTGTADQYAAALDMAEWADADVLRETGHLRVLTPDRLVDELRGSPAPFVNFHPLCGGMPIDLAWTSLRLFEREVLPAFAGTRTPAG